MRYSQLKARTVRAAILVLVQHNILWHATSEDAGEVFEVNSDECLTRLRFGRYVWLAEQHSGTPVRHGRCMWSTHLALNKRCCRVPELSSFFLTMENFVHQISCRVSLLQVRKVRASRSACPPLLDFLIQIPLYIRKPCTSSSPRLISSRRPHCRTYPPETSELRTKQRKRGRSLAFRPRRSFA